MLLLAAATAGSGPIAIITALGGVCVSLATVYFNNKKQTRDTEIHATHIEALTNQITGLAAEVAVLRSENASLKSEIRVLRERIS